MPNNKEKIQELKNKIHLEQEALLEFLKDNKLEGERTEDEKQKFKSDLALRRATLSELKKELELVRMNKNMSSYFEWIPSPGPNRKMRRSHRILNRKGGKTKSK